MNRASFLSYFLSYASAHTQHDGERRSRSQAAVQDWLARKQAEEQRQRQLHQDKCRRWAAEARRIKHNLSE